MPLNHVAGLSVVTRALASGTPVEVLPHFDAAVVDEAARSRGATITTLVPTALARIEPSLYRVIVVGGSHPPDSLPVNVVASYGLTESGSAVAYDGHPLEGVALRIRGGVIEIRGPMLARAYRAPDAETDDTPLTGADGWFRTGDRGSIDADGVVRVDGRADDVIITGGENVWPAAVEQVLETHPGVAEVGVAGRPDAEWGQRVVAWIVPSDRSSPPSIGALRAFCKERLPAYAAPREVVVVSSLPRTHLGKIRRNALLAHG